MGQIEHLSAAGHVGGTGSSSVLLQSVLPTLPPATGCLLQVPHISLAAITTYGQGHLVSFMHERHIGNAQMNSTLVCLGWSCRKDRTSCVLVAILSATAVPALTPGDVPSTLPHTSLRLPFVQGKFVQNAVKWAAGGKAFGIRVAVADTSWSTRVLERLVANVRLGGEGQGVQATGSEGQRHQQPHRGRVTSVALSCPSLSRVKLTRLAILVQDSALFTIAGVVAAKDVSVDVADVLLVSRGSSEQLSSQARP